MCEYTHITKMFSKNRRNIFSNAHGYCLKIDLIVKKINYNSWKKYSPTHFKIIQ